MFLTALKWDMKGYNIVSEVLHIDCEIIDEQDNKNILTWTNERILSLFWTSGRQDSLEEVSIKS